MLYVVGIITALQIVLAQTLWKLGLAKLGFSATRDYLLSTEFIKLFFSLYIMGGILLYASATITFFILLSKFNYAHSQTVVVVGSLIFAFLSAVIIFNEQLNILNILGISLLLIGAVLITRF